ncbi:IclR family transcriptional regulator [Rhodococcus rhodnii]|uniref:IclR family transcriptional regulator n=1 Tax=Rhodococcus rhodnii TaxID=38312 RepID=A0A6P2CKK8_9NOCA|nr:IclR family transcriptional regulator [Rhodococcus rhodnii]
MQKALLLLEAVAEIGSGATAKQIAAHTRIPPATAYRLLNLLVADGYLVRIADLSGFALGLRTRQLAGAAEDVDPRANNSAVLGELRSRVRYGIFLATFENDRVQFTDRDPDHELAGETAIGQYPHASALGKLLLAGRPHLAVADLRRVTTHTTVDAPALRRELDAVREHGVAYEVDETRPGRSAVAVAVYDDGPLIAGGLAAIGRTGHLPVADAALVELLREYARRVTVRVAA